MTRSPIDMLMDKVDWKCTRCGAKQGTCDCWVEIILRCPQCKKTRVSHREEIDPKGTAVVEFHCPECHDGVSKSEVFFFDKDGKQLGFEK